MRITQYLFFNVGYFVEVVLTYGCYPANFTVYQFLKTKLQDYQSSSLNAEAGSSNLPGWQTAAIGLVSGACGPFTNAPIDTIKTRLQRTPAEPGQTAIQRITSIGSDMLKTEGPRAFYKGITPRVMRVAPGQAVTFTVYDRELEWFLGCANVE